MTGTTPPGWYHDGTAVRWWDGTAWGPYAPAVPAYAPDPVAEGKGAAVVSHLGFLACWFVIPLIVRSTAGTTNAYVRHHATEALNFMICASVLYFVVWGFWIVGFFSAAFADGTADSSSFVIWWILLIGIQLIALAFAITGAVRASQGVWWRYPISIRFVRP